MKFRKNANATAVDASSAVGNAAAAPQAGNTISVAYCAGSAEQSANASAGAKKGRRKLFAKAPESIRREKKRKPHLAGLSVGADYPLDYSVPDCLGASIGRAEAMCAAALSRGGIDEASVQPFANCTIGAGRDQAFAELRRRRVRNFETLNALAVAEAEQLAWLDAMDECYQLSDTKESLATEGWAQ